MAGNSNRIVNLTADNSWQDVPNMPRNYDLVAIQHRDQTDVLYRYADNESEYFTVKASTVREISGLQTASRLQVRATSGIIEFEFRIGRW